LIDVPGVWQAVAVEAKVQAWFAVNEVSSENVVSACVWAHWIAPVQATGFVDAEARYGVNPPTFHAPAVNVAVAIAMPAFPLGIPVPVLTAQEPPAQVIPLAAPTAASNEPVLSM
jgi:hypothetical protein